MTKTDSTSQKARVKKDGDGAAIRGASRATQAYLQLKEDILSNVLPTGYQALEQEIAERLEMSRTPVREAFLRLQEDGLVDVVPRRGMRVKPVSIDDMREIYELLYCVEATAAELLAARHLGPESEELRKLEEANDEMERCLENDDLNGWAEADARFHSHLVEFCGNSRLARIANSLALQCHRVRLLTLRLRPRPFDSTSDHRAVVKAIRDHDEELAHNIQRAHRRRAMRLILDALVEFNLSQV